MNFEYGDVFDKIYKVISLFFNVTKAKLDRTDIGDLYNCFTQIQLYINETISSNFLKINEVAGQETVKQEKSFFDDYDIEEGYIEEDEEESVYNIYRESLNNIIKYAIKNMRMSYKESIECNLSEMLDYIVFNIKNDMENRDED